MEAFLWMRIEAIIPGRRKRFDAFRSVWGRIAGISPWAKVPEAVGNDLTLCEAWRLRTAASEITVVRSLETSYSGLAQLPPQLLPSAPPHSAAENSRVTQSTISAVTDLIES